jgi:hypothetical protein
VASGEVTSNIEFSGTAELLIKSGGRIWKLHGQTFLRTPIVGSQMSGSNTLAQPWTPLYPNDSDIFSINPNVLLSQDGSSVTGTPVISCVPSDMVASAVTVDNNSFFNFVLQSGSNTGVYQVTVTFSTTTRGPLHRTCQLSVVERS